MDIGFHRYIPERLIDDYASIHYQTVALSPNGSYEGARLTAAASKRVGEPIHQLHDNNKAQSQ
ncbi:hypothetical protein ACLBWZ_15825 [Brucellaceae bacterium C25G]